MEDIRCFKNKILIAKIGKRLRLIGKKFSSFRSAYKTILRKYYLFQVNNKSVLKLYYQENILCNDIIVTQKRRIKIAFSLSTRNAIFLHFSTLSLMEVRTYISSNDRVKN